MCPKQKERRKKGCGCNHFQTERLPLERNVGSSETIEVNKFFFLGDCTVLFIWSKENSSAGDALLLSSSELVPELGAGCSRWNKPFF